MEILLVICLIVILIFYLRLKRYKKKSKEEIKNEFQKEFDEERRKLSQQLSKEQENTTKAVAAEQLNRENQLYAIRRHNAEVIQLENDKAALELEATKKEIENAREQVRIELSGARELEIQSINYDLMQRRKEAQKNYKMFLSGLDKELKQKKDDYQIQIDEIEETLSDFKRKQEAIGQEILRRRAIEEQQDFYRICLSESSKEDIKYLLSIIDNIKNKQVLYKLVWSEYLQKPFKDLLKRILSAEDPRCVIYKITNIKTGEIYIGKTKAEVSKRWTEHIKTSLNIGTVARSKIHEVLFLHWDDFTFEILEKVKDENKLSSREKYYINFYQSNIYGYNMNSGG